MHIETFRVSRRFSAEMRLVLAAAGFPIVGFAQTISTDFNGDGKVDTTTVKDASGAISIAHDGGGQSDYFVSRNWLSMTACECNGVAGQELVAAYNDGEISIVDDRAKNARNYYVDPVGPGRAMFFSNSKGGAGMEVVLVYNNGDMYVVDDRARVDRDYVTQPIGSGRVVLIADLNGTAGNEIAVIFNGGSAYVIDDRIAGTRFYIVDPDAGRSSLSNDRQFRRAAG